MIIYIVDENEAEAIINYQVIVMAVVTILVTIGMFLF